MPLLPIASGVRPVFEDANPWADGVVALSRGIVDGAREAALGRRERDDAAAALGAYAGTDAGLLARSRQAGEDRQYQGAVRQRTLQGLDHDLWRQQHERERQPADDAFADDQRRWAKDRHEWDAQDWQDHQAEKQRAQEDQALGDAIHGARQRGTVDPDAARRWPGGVKRQLLDGAAQAGREELQGTQAAPAAKPEAPPSAPPMRPVLRGPSPGIVPVPPEAAAASMAPGRAGIRGGPVISTLGQNPPLPFRFPGDRPRPWNPQPSPAPQADAAGVFGVPSPGAPLAPAGAGPSPSAALARRYLGPPTPAQRWADIQRLPPEQQVQVLGRLRVEQPEIYGELKAQFHAR